MLLMFLSPQERSPCLRQVLSSHSLCYRGQTLPLFVLGESLSFTQTATNGFKHVLEANYITLRLPPQTAWLSEPSLRSMIHIKQFHPLRPMMTNQILTLKIDYNHYRCQEQNIGIIHLLESPDLLQKKWRDQKIPKPSLLYQIMPTNLMLLHTTVQCHRLILR